MPRIKLTSSEVFYNLLKNCFSDDCNYDRNDEIVGFYYCGQTYSYVKNLQGDVTAIIIDEGFLAAKYVYDDWGNCISIESGYAPNDIANLNPFRYRGYYYDNDTGLYYLQHRYFDLETGRFINCDDVNHIGFTESEVGYNTFDYCENNLVNKFDSSGISVVLFGNRMKTTLFSVIWC